MRYLLPLLILAVTVYGIVDCAQADDRTRRGIPLWAWVLLMLLVPGIGAIVWLIVSRLIEPTAPAPRSRPLAPDDDPDFLRYLKNRNKPADSTGTSDSTGPADSGTTAGDGDEPAEGDNPAESDRP